MAKKIGVTLMLAGVMFLFAGTASAQYMDYPMRACTTYVDCGDWEDPCKGFVDCIDGTCVRTVENNPCLNQGTNNECRAIPGEPPDDYDCFLSCDDDDDCPYGICVNGECFGGECSSDEECNDDNICNGVEECTDDGVCTDPEDLVCDKFCDPILGCIDCLTNDDCDYGTCSPEGVCVDGECASDGECDDNDVCTGVETCSPDGVCIDPDDLVCDDFCDPILGCVECLTNDDCPFGTCSGAGECLPGGCSSDADCDDNNICTGVETCTNDGECTEPDALECPELCDPIFGCVECLDDDDCPFGTCNPEGVCEEGECASDNDCNDNDICTGVETCTNDGVCTDPNDLVCPDFCDPILGCVECLTNDDCPSGTCSGAGECLPGGCTGDADCDDNNICTGVETCTNDGECTEPDALECPELCDPVLGCVECLDDEDCPFGTCVDGACVEGACSSDADCDDNDICNGVEMCMNDGTCFSPDPIECPEFCDPILGCVQCLENEDCPAADDICDEGECLPGPQTICGLKISPKKLNLKALFSRGERLFKITGLKNETAFDPYGTINFGEYIAQRTYVKEKKKGALLKVKVRVHDETNINDLPTGPLAVSVGDCTGQILVK